LEKIVWLDYSDGKPEKVKNIENVAFLFPVIMDITLLFMGLIMYFDIT
jgi:hypothetical protein